jgi:hypothetical protein
MDNIQECQYGASADAETISFLIDTEAPLHASQQPAYDEHHARLRPGHYTTRFRTTVLKGFP